MGTVPVGRKRRAEATGGPQVFRSVTGIIVWWVWVLFAVANLIDLAVQGRDRLSLVAAAILALVTGIAYVTAQRPRIIADTAGVTIVNPLRDHHIGWAGVTKVDLADLLRVHCRRGPDDTKVVYSWAVHYSRRRKLAAENKARRTAARAGSGRSSFGTFGLENYGHARRDLGYGSAPGGEAASAAEAEAERVARVLSEYATAARAETVWAEGTVQIAGAGPAAEDGPAGHIEPAADGFADLRVTGWLEPLKSTWNRTALLALLIPALILLIVAVV
ncbi:MAG TPA: PH domain-containing protein [Streptosporangiaceae bacterium]|nr:PH domain-containing protein [Streptosporangiaceae bacterium]